MWWILSVALGATPDVEVEWSKKSTSVVVSAPQGFHFGESAPAVVVWAPQEGPRVTVETNGEGLSEPLVMPAHVGSIALSGEVPLCEDGGSTCQQVPFEGVAELTGSKGLLKVVVTEPQAPKEASFPAQQDAQQAFDAALAEGLAQGKPVLVDFSAVWCPPCQLLAEQLLHAKPLPVELEGFVVVELDVDDPSSWSTKARYEVRGYPTMIVVDGQGDEIGRLEGYPGQRKTLDWMTLMEQTAEGADSPYAIARRAWNLYAQDKPEEALALAEGLPEGFQSVETQMLSLATDPRPSTLEWLIDNAPTRVLEWGEVLPDDETWLPRSRRALERCLPALEGETAADALYFLAQEAAEEVQPDYYAAAAAIMATVMTHDMEADKGHIGWYARLLELAGAPERAETLFDEAIATFPDEPTFYWGKARFLRRQGRLDEALAVSNEAIARAWGDNLLMIGTNHAAVLMDLGRVEEAQAFVSDTLAAVPDASEESRVRNGRLRKRLEETLDAAP